MADTGAPRALTLDEINEVLRHESRRRGYCLCAVPLRLVVEAIGFDCKLCGQEITSKSYGEHSRYARGDALRAAFPWITENQPVNRAEN